MKVGLLSKNNTNFKSIIVPDKIVSARILKNLDEKNLIDLKNVLIKQKSNPVNAYIGLDGKRLTASLQCEYRLKDFKEKYKQIPLIESNVSFIKRIARKCDEYKAQLENIL